MTPLIRESLPPGVVRAMRKLGSDISVARRRRRLTIANMCARIGISKQTYQRIESGEPAVSMGAYVAAMFSLGLGDAIGLAVDMGRDETGLLLEMEQLPKRIRHRKEKPFEDADGSNKP